MSSEPPSADQFAEQFGDNPVMRSGQDMHPYCRVCGSGMYAETEDGICSQVCSDKLTPPQQPEPTYTMSQAIDRIVDGLRLEWKDDDVGGRVRRITSSNGIFASYRVVEFGDRFVAVIPSGNVVCGSIQHGQQLCLNVEKRRFRAELEKAVKQLQ